MSEMTSNAAQLPPKRKRRSRGSVVRFRSTIRLDACSFARLNHSHSLKRLERLPKCYEILRRFHAGDGIQVAADVDTYRTNLREITNTETDVVRVVAGELTCADGAEDVAAIVENCAAEIVDELDRKAHFGIDYCQHASAIGDADERTGRSVVWIRADGHGALRTGAIDRKSA